MIMMNVFLEGELYNEQKNDKEFPRISKNLLI